MKSPTVTLRLSGILLALAPLAFVPSASAQTDKEEITVTGRRGTAPDSVRTLSAVVSYADLDLGTAAGKDRLRQRITLTARYLCETLGDTGASAGPATSCQDDASRDAISRAGTIEEKFAPRGTAWAPAPAWRPPYPPEWER
jgi:UrcA family protein